MLPIYQPNNLQIKKKLVVFHADFKRFWQIYTDLLITKIKIKYALTSKIWVKKSFSPQHFPLIQKNQQL